MRKFQRPDFRRDDDGGAGTALRAREALQRAVEVLGDRAEAVLVRTPMIDPRFPETSDLDLLAVGDVEDFFPERVSLGTESTALPKIDLIWLPLGQLEEVRRLAKLGLIGHRILSSDIVADRTGLASRKHGELRVAFFDPDLQAERIAGFLEMGFLTVQEIGVTWQFPALALFWIHLAYAACLAALVDGTKGLCPNVFTRPFDAVPRAEPAAGLALGNHMVETLHLRGDVTSSAHRLRRMVEVVTASFPEPAWPAGMRQITRYEYRYFSSRSELDWRIRAAGEMSRLGSPESALFYLRFWAYSLARLPMVHQRALEGVDVSFVRPSRMVLPDLERLCPEIIDDLALILGGDDAITDEDIRVSLDKLYTLRDHTLDFLAVCGLRFPELKAWAPYEAPRSLATSH
ncbi:MAG TPA: hypothetical protein VK845_10915 [Gemmatimonadales bacterium]|nr:hypothetical protein [Gemmatimonadales bacterium]